MFLMFIFLVFSSFGVIGAGVGVGAGADTGAGVAIWVGVFVSSLSVSGGLDSSAATSVFDSSLDVFSDATSDFFLFFSASSRASLFSFTVSFFF